MTYTSPNGITTHEEFVTNAYVYTVLEFTDGRWEVQISERHADKHRYREFETHDEAIDFCQKEVDRSTE